MSTPKPPRPPDGVPEDLPDGAGPNLRPVQDSWERLLAELLGRWGDLSESMRDRLLEQVRESVQAGDILGLDSIGLDPTDLAAHVEASMARAFTEAAEQIGAEARRQKVEVSPAGPDRYRTAALGQLFAVIAQRNLITSAMSEAVRLWRPGMRAGDVAEGVGVHLDSLTDAYPRLLFGSGLSMAQHDGRLRTIAGGPEAALYADEILDKNTCGPCRAVDRKWLGNASDAMVLDTYPTGGYVGCEGRWRCRGQVVAIWRGGTDWTKWIEPPARRGE